MKRLTIRLQTMPPAQRERRGVRVPPSSYNCRESNIKPMEPNLQSQFSDIDLLTGCWNLVSFTKGIQNNFGNEDLSPITLIGIDVHQLRRVNRIYGFERGDQLLRWLGIALRDEMGNPVYRIAGDAFVIVIVGSPVIAHNGRARNHGSHSFSGRRSFEHRPGMEEPE
jgi:GGDEF domain-containing protein